MNAALLLIALQIQVPAPRGYVNDFAGVLDPASVSRMDSVISAVRAATRGEIAVVTLADIGDRAAADVAVQIGREWGVGAKGEAGDPAKNLGIVVLLVPLKEHRPGTGQVFIATGRGAEGFLPDAQVGRIRDAMVPYLAREQYGPGLAAGVDLIAQAFAREFGVTIATREEPAPASDDDGTPMSTLFTIILVMALFMLLARRGGIWPLLFLMSRGRGGRGGWSGGGGWGGRGGGFGGFGGGGGFSGGGAGGRF